MTNLLTTTPPPSSHGRSSPSLVSSGGFTALDGPAGAKSPSAAAPGGLTLLDLSHNSLGDAGVRVRR
jgi:hypothetical protein